MKPGDGINKVTKRRKDGAVTVYYYHRATRRRLAGTPGTPEFQASWEKAERAGRLPAPAPALKGGAWAELIDAYQRSHDYAVLVRSTRNNFDRVARMLIARWGWMEKGDIEDRSVRDAMLTLRDEIAATGKLNTADKVMQSACRVLSFAYDRGRIAFNHGMRMRYIAPTGTRRGISFDAEMQAKVLAAIDADFALAFRLALYTGIRAGDLCRLTWSDLDAAGWLYVRPSKTQRSTNVEIWLPTQALPPLGQAIAAAPRRRPEILSYVSRWSGDMGGTRAWTPGTLKRRWMEIRAELGLSHLHWHDLRGTCIQGLSDAGCTEDEQAAISGHSLAGRGRSQLGNYKQISRTLAERAYGKWAAAMDPDSKIVAFRR